MSTGYRDGVTGSSPLQDNECPICYNHWTNSGDRRLASVPCGHLMCRAYVDLVENCMLKLAIGRWESARSTLLGDHNVCIE
jgi:hypothetical protein